MCLRYYYFFSINKECINYDKNRLYRKYTPLETETYDFFFLDKLFTYLLWY